MKIPAQMMRALLVLCVVSGFAGPLGASEQLVNTRIKGFLELDLHNGSESVTNNVLSFRLHDAVLFVNPSIGDRIQGMFTLVAAHGGMEIEIWNAYIDYHLLPEATFRYGVDLAPFGRWENERINIHSRDMRVHPNVLFKGLFPQTVMGAYALGIFSVGPGDVNYRLGVVNSEDTMDAALALREDSQDPKTVIGRVGYDLFSGLGLGISGYSGASYGNKMKESDKALYGADIFWRLGRVKLTGEYIKGSITPVAGAPYEGEGYYAQVGYMLLDKLTLSYRYDTNDKDKTAVTNTMDEGTEHVIGLAFRPDPNYVVFSDFRMHTTETGTYRNRFVISFGLTF